MIAFHHLWSLPDSVVCERCPVHSDRYVMFLDRSIRFVFRRSHFPRSKSPFHALACRIKQLMYKSRAVFAICDAHRQRSWELGSECRRPQKKTASRRTQGSQEGTCDSSQFRICRRHGNFRSVCGRCGTLQPRRCDGCFTICEPSDRKAADHARRFSWHFICCLFVC